MLPEPDDILAALDERQAEAVTSLLGPTVILAGAGTGKTRTITHRIAYGIVRGDFSEQRVLALTYTNRAAGELRSRLRQLGVNSASAKTFHSAALAQLEYFFRTLYGIAPFRVLDSKAKAIAQAAKDLKLQLDPNQLRDIASEIEWRKYSLLSIDDYAEQLSGRSPIAGIGINAMVEIQKGYEQLNLKSKQMDWEDVILLCSGMLRGEPRALAQVQQQYRFFTVDEYQDISPLQQDLLDTWLGDRSDICVVGDPNQTIYSFTGASSSYLENFSMRYPEATVVQLNRNYRSTPEIIRVANRVRVSQSIDALETDAQSFLSPVVKEFEDSSAEATWVANQVALEISKGTKPSQIAVLYRVNSQSESIENALRELGIESQVRGGQRYFNRPDVMAAIRLVRAEAAMPSDKNLYETITSLVRSLGWQSVRPTSTERELDSWEALNHLVLIAEELGPDATIKDYANELEERQRSQHEPVKELVTLATIHAAKGLEFDSVYIIGAIEGFMPISYAKTEAEYEEEQRLFYVAVTRAKKQLTVTYPKKDSQSGRENTKSRYLNFFD